MVNFRVVDKKVSLEVNRGAASRAGITISARLLKLAKIVVTK